MGQTSTPDPADVVVVKKPSELAVDDAGTKCEDTLRKVIQGDYQLLPLFAVQVLQYFQHTESFDGDVNQFCCAIGMKGAHLLAFCKSEIDRQETAELQSTEKRAPIVPVSTMLMLVATGCALREDYLWSGAGAYIACQLIETVPLKRFIADMYSISAFVVFCVSYFWRRDPFHLGVAHVVACLLVVFWQTRHKSTVKRE